MSFSELFASLNFSFTHIFIQVQLPLLRIQGNMEDLYFDPGSTIFIICKLSRDQFEEELPSELAWAKDDELIDIHSRKEIRYLKTKVNVSKYLFSLGHRISGEHLESHFSISHCSHSDAGER